MATAVTNGIKVSVETFYKGEINEAGGDRFAYAYRVTILNESDSAITLLRRHWFISDSLGNKREVEGEGVIGEQPTLKSGQSYQYVSGCTFNTEAGKMYGTYLMQRVDANSFFDVTIPEFVMMLPCKLN